MKTIPPPCPEFRSDRDPQYWRSLDQLADTPEFRQWVEREFPAGASEFTDPVSRRHFVKIMSASFLLAGLGAAGCRRPEEKILPFSKLPENYTYGVAQYYATARPVRGSAVPLLVKSHEGRPTKIEGNPEHPLNRPADRESHGQPFTGTDPFTQASILNLYDPDRAVRFAKNGNTANRQAALDFLADLSKQAQSNRGQGLCFLLERSSSPTRARLQMLMAEKYPEARWFVFEPVDFDIHRQAATVAFGKSVRPAFKLDAAKVIVSLDCDFIGAEEEANLHIRRFAAGRRPEKPGDPMNRLFAIEGLLTQTGANADHRLRVPTSAVQAIAARLALEILKQTGGGSSTVSAALSKLAEGFKGQDAWIQECAKDLVGHGNHSLVLAGHRQPLAVHVIAHAINATLGGLGATVAFYDAPESKEGTLGELAQALNNGQVSTLVVLGGNPVYNAPADLDWPKTQRKARTVVRLGYSEDETFAVSDWHLPMAHYLESWGDARTSDGTLVPIQPLIAPLFGGLTELDVLARIGGLEKVSANDLTYELVRETFRGLAGEGEDRWEKFLHDGFLANSQAQPAGVRFNADAALQAVSAAIPMASPSKDKLEVVFHRDYSVDDGRYNNNGWLQEMPDPITKMVWENVMLISQATATELGLQVEDKENLRLLVPRVKLHLGAREIEGPVWVQPGLADHTIGLALGYGRKQTGRVGRDAGYDAYRVRTSAQLHLAAGAKLTSAGQTQMLASTQNHWAMEGRPIIREANWAQYRDHPDFVHAMDLPEPHENRPLYPNPFDKLKEKAHHQWGMAIDLSACVGCSACMMACQSENNIPIVGKDQVRRNREMHWIRIDRYYTGPVADPQAINQPMLCQHCESAPCESVCPVNATVHDEEGLNVMVYNRCVGTRYCSNNCPYKVRRFNYFDYNRRPLDQLKGPIYPTPLTSSTDGEWDLKRWWNDLDRGNQPDDTWELTKLLKNPDVSVRMRGVMEKCTYCLQRIEHAKIAQKVKAGASGAVRLKEQDGNIPKTACQQACPAEAIVFGDVSDPESRVSKLKEQPRNYTVLEFLATKPRTTYLARIRNPNPAISDPYSQEPGSMKEIFKDKHGDPFAIHGGGGKGTPAIPGHPPSKGAH